jgi:transposase
MISRFSCLIIINGNRLEDVSYVFKTPFRLIKSPYPSTHSKGAPHRTLTLNTLQFETKIVYKVLRLKDPDSGMTEMAAVPWAGKHSRFTLMFEAFAVEVLLASSSVEAARKLLGLDWRTVDQIRERAVERGLAKREDEPIRYLGIDEKSFRKGHKYVSVATDLENSRVLEVVDGRTESSTNELMGILSGQLGSLEAAAMDMWPAYMNTLRQNAWYAFIVHDRFHVSAHLSKAIDSVRKQEHRELKAESDESLKNSRWTCSSVTIPPKKPKPSPRSNERG